MLQNNTYDMIMVLHIFVSLWFGVWKNITMVVMAIHGCLVYE